MFIQSHLTTPEFTSPTGELGHELGGLTTGGLTQHSLAYITVPPGVQSPKHYHPAVEESYYILSGQARMVVDGESQQVGPGQMIAIGLNQVHQIFNESDSPLVMLVTCAPPWTPDCSVFVA
jgi:mannose-6-phosphate isomerase-like protein (cupin superfamily)